MFLSNDNMKTKKFSPRDKKLKDWLKKGGLEGAKKDFIALLLHSSTRLQK